VVDLHVVAAKILTAVLQAAALIAVGLGIWLRRPWVRQLGLFSGVAGIVLAGAMRIIGVDTAPGVHLAAPVTLALAALFLVFGPRYGVPTDERATDVPRITVVSHALGFLLVLQGGARLYALLGSRGSIYDGVNLHVAWVTFSVGFEPPVPALADLASYIALLVGLPLAMIVAGFGLSLRRGWGRQLTAAVSLLSIPPSVALWSPANMYESPVLNGAYVVGSALAFFYSLVPVRARKAMAFAEHRASARAAVPPSDTRSSIAGASNWREALMTSLQSHGVRHHAPGGVGRLIPPIAGIFVLALIEALGAGALRLATTLGDLPQGLHIVLSAVWFGMGVVVFARLVGSLRRRLRQFRARSAEQELQRPDARRPILYLRSFGLDEHTARPSVHELLLGSAWATTLEEKLARTLGRCGPVIAIGRPDEALPGLGAARFYVDDDVWQQKVADVASVSSLVVWTSGTSPGLRWEVEHLLATVPAERLVVWAHPHLLNLGATAREAEWSRFISALGGVFARPLPQRLAGIRLIHFRADGEPVPVASRSRWTQWLPWPFVDGHVSALRALLRAKDLPPFDAQRLAKRRRLVRALAGGVAVVLVAGLVTLGLSLWQLHRETRAVAERFSWERLADQLIEQEWQWDFSRGRHVPARPATVRDDLRRTAASLREGKEWRWEHISSKRLDSMRVAADDYVAMFDELRTNAPLEDVWFLAGPSVVVTLTSVAGVEEQLVRITRLSALVERSLATWQSLPPDARLTGHVEKLIGVTGRRGELLRAEAALMRMLMGKVAASDQWQRLTAERDGAAENLATAMLATRGRSGEFPSVTRCLLIWLLC
jgi:hypothetical protein